MSVPGQSSIFSVALQKSKVGNGAFDVSQQSWYRTRAPRIGLGTQDMADVFPAETGGPIIPTGAFKMGAFGAGDVELIPRLEQFISLMFYGAMGKMTSSQNSTWNKATNTFAAGTTGVWSHRYTFDPENTFFLPWMAVRTFVPGASPDKNFGQVGIDFKIGSISISIPAMGLLGMSVSFQGRKMSYPLGAHVNGWAYANTNEDSVSAPISNKGVFLLGGIAQPITQASIEIANSLTDPRQEMVIGQYFPDDFVPLSRRVSLRIVYKWDNADFYRQILTNGVNNVDWSSVPFVQDTTGGTKAFEARFESAANISGSAPVTPYSVSFIANRVFWQLDKQGIQLQAGGIILVPYVGTVLEPLPGQEYFEIIHTNKSPLIIPVDGNTPVLGMVATRAYTGAAITLDVAATVTDDDANFQDGSLTFSWVGGDNFDILKDRFTLGASVTVTGNNVQIGGLTVGALENGLPAIGQNLSLLLTVNATPANVQTLIRAVTYTPTPLTVRTGEKVAVRVTLSDSDDAFVSKVVTIQH